MNDLTLNSLLELLRESPAFDHLQEKALVELSSLFSHLDLTSGGSLPIRRGHNEPYLYLIDSGSFDLTLLTTDAPAQTLITLKRSSLIGGFLSYTSHNTEVDVTSQGSGSVFRVLKEDLDGFFCDYSQAFGHFSNALRNTFYQAQLSLFFLLEFQISDPNIFDSLIHDIQWKELQNGSVLFRQGDPGDAIYIAISGRLKSVERTADGKEKLSNIINTGQISGEVAFLTQSARIATVFAIRDSVVAEFSREVFNKLVTRHPQVMSQVARLLGHRFKFQTSKRLIKKVGKTYALIPSQDDYCLKSFVINLKGVMQEWGSVACITSNDIEKSLGIKGGFFENQRGIHEAQISQWLEQLEFSFDYVILVADRTWSDWNKRILHYSDHLLIIAESDQSCEPSITEEKIFYACRSLAKHQHKSLILIHPHNTPISGTHYWLSNRHLKDWCHIRTGVEADMQRLGRLLTGNANALVLGGGGARGYAHIGVIRALEEQSIPIDMVCGTSVGAIISSALAMEYESKDLIHLCKKHFRNVFDYTLPILSLIRGRWIMRHLGAVFGDKLIEDLVIPFFCVSTNLTRAEEVIHDRGSLLSATRSSMSLPAMIPPMCKNGDLIVDGGLLNNLPIDEMRRRIGACNIIAVDISPKLDLTNNENFSPEISGFRLLMARLNPFQKRLKAPSILQVLERSITVAAVNYSAKMQEKKMADLYLELPVETVGTLDYDKVDQIAALGYTASIMKIKNWANKSI